MDLSIVKREDEEDDDIIFVAEFNTRANSLPRVKDENEAGNAITQDLVPPCPFKEEESERAGPGTTSQENPDNNNSLAINRKEVQGEMLTCATCAKIFPRIEDLRAHVEQHSSEGSSSSNVTVQSTVIRILKCRLCFIVFVVEAQYRKHMRKVHSEIRPFKCPVAPCTASFKLRAGLKRHKLVHSKVRPYTCVICLATFQCLDTLTKHMKRENCHAGQPSSQEEQPTVPPFSCNVCAAKLESNEALKEHEQRLHPFQVFNCTMCSASFSLRVFLETHMRKHGKEKLRNKIAKVAHKSFTCNQCEHTFRSSADFRFHMRNKHRIFRPFTCDSCPEKFSLNARLAEHKLVHISEGPFQCQLCSAKFKTIDEKRKHMTAHKEALRCRRCHKIFKSSDKLSCHFQSMHSKEARTCKICGIKFNWRPNLMRHLKTVHKTDCPYKCSYCNLMFKSMDTRSKHIKRFHSDADLKCETCNSTFSCKSALRRHLKVVHSNERPFKCQNCAGTFKCNDTLTKHMKGVHGKKAGLKGRGGPSKHSSKQNNSKQQHKGQLFRCPKCPKLFTMKSNVYRHCRNFHAIESAGPASSKQQGNSKDEEINVKCSKCPATFTAESNRNRHYKIVHLNKGKPQSKLNTAKSSGGQFQCEVCHKAFSNNANLQRHRMVVHTDERPHACLYCPKKFKCTDSRRIHMKHVHRKK